MFKLNVMDEFRSSSQNTEKVTMTDDVKDAWICFLKDFCTLVSYEWNEYLNNIVKKEKATFFGSLSTSDEAFTEWAIRCKYAEAALDTEEILKNGKEAWFQSRKKRKRGPHDSREKLGLYSQLYNKILLHRANKVSHAEWQKIFFDKYIPDNVNANNKESDLEESSAFSNTAFRIPALDGELDGFSDDAVVRFPI
jgi:hypothetical protein